ncbi:MAG: TonB-dependent receptor [Pseudomonadota bacterium]
MNKFDRIAFLKYSLLNVTSAAAFLTHASIGWAQLAADDIDEEIFVAGRFQQSLINRIPITQRELPYSLAVIDREFLDERGSIRAIDALQNLPNLTISRDFNNTGTVEFLTRGYFATVLVNNRVQNAGLGAGFRDDSFVERYEVLKGPASISLGPVLPGGIINSVTKSPEANTFFAYELVFDQFGTVMGEVDVNAGSVFNSNKIRARLSAAYRNVNFDADRVSREAFAIRPVVEIDFSDKTSSQFSVSYRTLDTVPNVGFPVLQDASVPDSITTDRFLSYPNAETDNSDVFVEGQVVHEFLDKLKLTLRGSYQNTDSDYVNTASLGNYVYDDGLPGVAPGNTIAYAYAWRGAYQSENTFVDAQLSGSFGLAGQRQDYVIGASYVANDILRPFGFDGTFGPFDLSTNDLENRVAPPLGTQTDPFVDDESTLYSVYSEVALRPTGWLTVLTGVRLDDLVVKSGGTRATTTDEQDVTFRIGATAAVTEDFSIYASFAESFIPQSGTIRGGNAIGPESAASYEIGFKGSLFSDRISFNGALFNTIRSNVATNDPSNNIDEFFVLPIGKQRNRGVEISSDIRLFKSLNVNLNYGFLDADIVSGEDLGNLVASNAPRHTFSTFATYEVGAGALQGLKFGGGLRFNGKRAVLGRSDIFYDSVFLADLFAAYRVNDGLTIQVNASNLTNKSYLESTGDGGGLGFGNQLGQPRTVILTVRGRF